MITILSSLICALAVAAAAEPQRSHCDAIFPNGGVPSVAKRVDELLESKHLEGAVVGVLAVAYPEGTILYEKNANVAFNPASVSKIFTAAAALDLLGRDMRFDTAVYVEEGDCPVVTLKGTGDPGLQAEEVRRLAYATRREGVKCVSGVRYDVSAFDGQALPPCFDQKQSDANWRPRIGALAMADAAVALTLRPGAAASSATSIEMVPDTSCLLVANKTTTVEGDAAKELDASIEPKGDKAVIHLKGEVSTSAAKNGVVVKLAVPDPDLTTACYFAEQLGKAGVRVENPVPEKGKAGKDVRKIATITSGPLFEDIKRMQEWSRNFVAEQLLKLFSGSGDDAASFRRGTRLMRLKLREYHLPTDCFKLRNASGLFNANAFTPAQIVRLLIEAANRGDVAEDFVASFAVSGRTGTMKDRLRRMDRKVRAKTGTLDDVSSLAGFVYRSEGHSIVFAIVFNKASASAERLRAIQDKIVSTFGMWAEGKLR